MIDFLWFFRGQETGLSGKSSQPMEDAYTGFGSETVRGGEKRGL